MLARKPERMTLEAFLAWEAEQPEKWEFVDGFPVRRSERWWHDPVTGMAGARRGHNRIVANLVRHLGNRLRGNPCEAFPTDFQVLSPTGNIRYPDIVVDCARGRDDDLQAVDPRVLFEVLSPSNRPSHQTALLADYLAISTLEAYVLVEQDRIEVQVFVPGQRHWPMRTYRELDDVLPLPMLGTELPLSEIYEDMDFEVASER